MGQPFGLKGFVKVRPFSGDLENLLKLREVTIRHKGKEQTLLIEESMISPQTAAFRGTARQNVSAASFVLMRFTGISSPEAAKALNGAEILVDRDKASPLEEGEFYIEDLKGLAVVSEENKELLGNINDILEGGAGDLVEIRLLNGKFQLVPFKKEFFSEISLEKGSVTLNKEWLPE